MGLGRVRFCVPGDVGQVKFPVNVVRPRCLSRVVRIPAISREHRTPQSGPPNKPLGSVNAKRRSLESGENASWLSGADPLSGPSQIPCLPSMKQHPLTSSSSMPLALESVTREALLVGADFCSRAFREDFMSSRPACHIDQSLSVCIAFVDIRDFAEIAAKLCSLRSNGQASWPSVRATGSLRSSGNSRTRPQTRVSDEEGNADQRPPARGKSNCHRGRWRAVGTVCRT